MATAPRIAGLDLSLTSTGFARVCGGEVALARIQPGKRKGHERLEFLAGEISVRVADAAVVVIEGPSYGSAGAGQHERAGLWWMTAHALWRAGTPYVVVTPSQVKKYACGTGSGPKAGKDQVLASVIRRYPSAPVDGNDQADALTLAAMGADFYGWPLADVPQVNRAALASVKGWPAVLPPEDGSPPS